MSRVGKGVTDQALMVASAPAVNRMESPDGNLDHFVCHTASECPAGAVGVGEVGEIAGLDLTEGAGSETCSRR